MKKIYFVLLSILLFSLFLSYLFFNFGKSSFVTLSDAETEIDLPIRKIKSLDFFSGIVVESCNNKLMTIPYIIVDNSDSILIRGWALDIDNKSSLSDLYIEVNGNYFPVSLEYERKDVADLFAMEDGASLGYSICFDKNILRLNGGDWSDKLNFYGVDKNGDSLLSKVEYNLLYAENEQTTPLKNSSKVLFMLDSVGSGYFNSETNKIFLGNDPYVSFRGWAIEGLLPLSKIFLVVNGKSYKMKYGVPRDLVKETLKVVTSNKLGYEFDFPKSLLLKEDGTYAEYVDFVPIDASGYVCERIRYSVVYQ